MRRRAILGLGISCLLAACAHQESAPTAGMTWSLHHAEGEGAKLAYGQPSSDNVLLMMTCQTGSGQVRVSLTAPAAAASQAIELTSKGASSRLAGVAAPAMAEGAALIEATAPASDPALARFARTGVIAVVENGKASPLPVRREERTSVSDFFAQCRTA